MNTRTQELAKIQTALWLAEKLARLCREILAARDRNDRKNTVRLEREIDMLVHSRDFADAVQAVGVEYFYPEQLRVLMHLLERGYADSLDDACALLGQMEI